MNTRLKIMWSSKAGRIALLATLLLLLDQVLKIWVKTHMTLGEEIPILGDWFKFHFIENPGAAYGLQFGGSWGKILLSLFRIGATIFLIWYIRKLIKRDRNAAQENNLERKVPMGLLVGLAVILAGAVGNIVDSVFYGVVFSESTYYTTAHWLSLGDMDWGQFMHGKVVDMLHFPIIEIEQMPDWVPIWGGEEFVFFEPVFNMADSYVTCGFAYLLIFHYKFFR